MPVSAKGNVVRAQLEERFAQEMDELDRRAVLGPFDHVSEAGANEGSSADELGEGDGGTIDSLSATRRKGQDSAANAAMDHVLGQPARDS